MWHLLKLKNYGHIETIHIILFIRLHVEYFVVQKFTMVVFVLFLKSFWFKHGSSCLCAPNYSYVLAFFMVVVT